MHFNFPPAPELEGLTYIGVMPVFFCDHRSGRRNVFPVYRYEDGETGELVLVSEDQYEPILDRMIEMGAFGQKDCRA